jgi:hypothetical protein
MVVSFLVDNTAIRDVFGLSVTSEHLTLLFLHELLGLMFMHDIGYFIVGQDIHKNRGILWLEVLSKLAFYSFCMIYFLRRDFIFTIVAFGSFDFFFAYLLWEYIINYEKP